MYNANIPADRELPPTGKLVKSTLLAIATAGVLLVTVVMPAEYGIDPTGVGNAIGLTKMGEIKTSLAQEVAADEAKKQMAIELTTKPQMLKTKTVLPRTQSLELQPSATLSSDELSVTLAPDEGTEIKVLMRKGATVSYEWWTDGGKANFDVHADSKKLKINYHNYSKGSEVRKSGEIIAAFDGSHGWFWRNRTNKNITITLKTQGGYSSIKHMK